MNIGKIINPGFNPQIEGLGAARKEIGVTGGEGGFNSLQKFGEMLAEGVNKVNHTVTDFEKISAQFSQGEDVNVHEMMLKGEQADMSFRLMLTMRTKIVEAYQEVMRLPV